MEVEKLGQKKNDKIDDFDNIVLRSFWDVYFQIIKKIEKIMLFLKIFVKFYVYISKLVYVN